MSGVRQLLFHWTHRHNECRKSVAVKRDFFALSLSTPIIAYDYEHFDFLLVFYSDPMSRWNRC